jgi:hypothetical protein
MFHPWQYWSVLDFGRLRTMPLSVKLTEPLEISERNEVLFQESHVNSPERRNPPNAGVNAARMLTSSSELLRVETIARSMSLVISPRSRIVVSPNTR